VLVMDFIGEAGYPAPRLKVRSARDTHGAAALL
jgi:hypothetical protein